jgi:hypothetical protein
MHTLCNSPSSFLSDHPLDLLEKASYGQEQDGGGGGGGDVGGGEFVDRVPCKRGGKSVRARREKQTRAQLRRANRIGPEGLGDRNNVKEEDEEDEENEEQEDETGPSRPTSIPEKAILSREAVNIVSALAAVARDCLLPSADSGIISNTHAVVQALQVPSPENELPQLGSRDVGNVVFLAALATCCQRAEILEAQAHLTYWLCVLTFACQMNRYVYLCSISTQYLTLQPFRVLATKPNETKYSIYKRIVEELKKSGANKVKQARTLDRYMQDGIKTAVLCGAGSFYMLILMSCSRIRPEVHKLKGPMCGRVAKLIRCPPGECFIIVSCL